MVLFFKANTKSEAWKKFTLINREISQRVQGFNSIRSLPILLCLEDAINNLEISLSRAHKIEKNFDGKLEHYFAIVNFITAWYYYLNDMIFDINKQGFYDPSTKIKTEGIAFGISLEEDYESDIIKFTNELREKGLIEKIPL